MDIPSYLIICSARISGNYSSPHSSSCRGLGGLFCVCVCFVLGGGHLISPPVLCSIPIYKTFLGGVGSPKRNTGKSFKRSVVILRGLQRFGEDLPAGV